MNNHNELRGLIRAKGYTLKEFAKIIGMSLSTLISKLKCRVDFTAKEIRNICIVLDIDPRDIAFYFFKDLLLKS